MNIQFEKTELIKRLAEVNNKKIIEQLKAILMPEMGLPVDETERVLSNPELANKLKAARKHIKEGKGVKKDIAILWQ